MEISIRAAGEPDLPGIFAIYDREVLHGTATFDTEPKSEAERREWLRQHTPPRHPVIVADAGGTVAGWAGISAWSTRCAYARAGEVSVYVHHEHRGRGVGRLLLEELVSRARGAGLGVLLARIVEGNPASTALHRGLAFNDIGVMRRVGEKFGQVLDVRLMDLHLDGR